MHTRIDHHLIYTHRICAYKLGRRSGVGYTLSNDHEAKKDAEESIKFNVHFENF